MDHTPEPLPSPPPGPLIADEAHLETLLRQTFAEQAAGVTAPPDALHRLNARLAAAAPTKRRVAPFRLAAALACALVLLAFLTPVGRLAAAGVHTAAETIATTVKQIASSNSDTTPPRGTAPAPIATDFSASRTAPTNGAESPAVGGTANPSPSSRVGTPAGTASQVAPLSPTPTPHATGQPVATSTATGTAITTTASPIGTPLSTATRLPPSR